MIHVKLIHAKVWHQSDTRNTSALTRNAGNAFVSLSFLLAAPGDPHAVPRCEASNFGTIPVTINRPASPNFATSNSQNAKLTYINWHHAFPLPKSVLSFDGKRTRKTMENQWPRMVEAFLNLIVRCLSNSSPIFLASFCIGEAPMSGRPPPANGAALLVARCCGVLDLSQSSEAFKHQD